MSSAVSVDSSWEGEKAHQEPGTQWPGSGEEYCSGEQEEAEAM